MDPESARDHRIDPVTIRHTSQDASSALAQDAKLTLASGAAGRRLRAKLDAPRITVAGKGLSLVLRSSDGLANDTRPSALRPMIKRSLVERFQAMCG